MTFLPVAQRELLAAARRKATFRMRIWTALSAAILTLLVLLFISMTGTGAQSGRWLFYVLISGGNLFAIVAGILLTSDSISEERRDGSLGFLFLTDLNGIDVVTGKFAGRALGSLYALTAVFPVIAISWFVGGISNGEFWRNCAVLLNQLFFSSAVGLAASVNQVRQSRALGIGLGILAVFVIGLPALAQLLLNSGRLPELLWLTLPSPTQTLASVRESDYLRNPAGFYWSLGTSHLTGWVFLLYASVALHRTWRSGAELRDETRTARQLDRKWLERDPIRSLLAADRWPVTVAWFTVCLSALAMLATPSLAISPIAIVLIGFTVVIKGLMAWEVTSFLGEARRTGALELLLSTPVRDGDLNRAIHAHLASRYLAPLILVVLCQFASGAMSGSLHLAIVDAIGTLFQSLVLGAVGIWFGLTESRPLSAFAKTFGFLVVLATPLDFLCCAGFGIPPILGIWAQSKLRLPYREILAGVRSHWQRRDGWMHSTGPVPWLPPSLGGGPPVVPPPPPPLPYRRDD